MLKRLLMTAVLAGSTLVVSGPAIAHTATAEARYAPIPASVTSARPCAANARHCQWRHLFGRWCYYCKRHGTWERIYCRKRI